MTLTEPVRESAPVDYRLGVGAPSGLWLGLGGTRLAVLAAGLLGTVTLLAIRLALPVSVGPLMLAAVVTLIPVAGRSLAGWTGPAATHATAVASGAASWRAPLPQLVLNRGKWRDAQQLRLPPECGLLRLAEVSDGSEAWPVGALIDGRSPSPVVCFAVAGSDRFSLLDPEDQDRLVAGWGQALATLSQRDGAAAHVQLLEWASVAEPDTDAAVSWARSRGGGSVSLLGAVNPATVRRDSVVAVRLHRVGNPGEVVQRARDVAAQLMTAELVTRPLGGDELGNLLARQLGPGSPARSGPVSRRTAWDHVRTDDTWHRSYAVAAWPGGAVPAGWLAPLLLAAPPAGAWALEVHLSAVAPEQAARLARAARVRAELDRADRARLGLPASAASDRAVAESAGMDAELVAGHATHRLAAVITCSAGSLAELDATARGLRDAAVGAGLAVAPLHGQHQLGIAATLPLCRLRFGGAR